MLPNAAATPLLNPYSPPPNADLMHPHIKRKRIDHQKNSTINVEDISTKLPEQILSDAHEEAFSTVNSELQHDPLSSTLTNVETYSDVTKETIFGLRNATTVTPSSLSSGCLSAVDTVSKPSMFFSADRVQLLQNIQVRKVQLLDSDSNQQLRNIASNQYSNFALSELAARKELVGTQEHIDVDGNSAIVNPKSYEALNLGPDMGILNSCQDVPQTINLCSNSSLLQTLVNVSPITNTHSIHNGDLIINGQNASSGEVLTNQSNCLPMPNMVAQNSSVIVNEEETQVCLASGVNTNSPPFDANRELEVSKLFTFLFLIRYLIVKLKTT